MDPLPVEAGQATAEIVELPVNDAPVPKGRTERKAVNRQESQIKRRREELANDRSILINKSLELENARLSLENRQLELDNRRLLWDIGLRIALATIIVILVSVWLWSIFHLVERQYSTEPSARLSDPVLIALLATTTVNVLGLLYTVARYLFPARADKQDRPPSVTKTSPTRKNRTRDTRKGNGA